MLHKLIVGGITSLVLALGSTSGQVAARANDLIPIQASQFRRIEQPFWVKATVTAIGLGLIGIEIWWFLLSKPKSR
jgi:plastocyanin domain-containing protein